MQAIKNFYAQHNIPELGVRQQISDSLKSQFEDIINGRCPFSEELNAMVRYEFEFYHALIVKFDFQWITFLFFAPDNNLLRDKFHRIRLDMLKLKNKKFNARKYLSGIQYIFKVYGVENIRFEHNAFYGF